MSCRSIEGSCESSSYFFHTRPGLFFFFFLMYVYNTQKYGIAYVCATVGEHLLTLSVALATTKRDALFNKFSSMRHLVPSGVYVTFIYNTLSPCGFLLSGNNTSATLTNYKKCSSMLRSKGVEQSPYYSGYHDAV